MKVPIIRRLNDQLRKGETLRGLIVCDENMGHMLPKDLYNVLVELGEFSAFDRVLDPYGTNEAGVFRYDSSLICFRIAYLDLSLTCESEDPADHNLTRRVLYLKILEH